MAPITKTFADSLTGTVTEDAIFGMLSPLVPSVGNTVYEGFYGWFDNGTTMDPIQYINRFNATTLRLYHGRRTGFSLENIVDGNTGTHTVKIFLEY